MPKVDALVNIVMGSMGNITVNRLTMLGDSGGDGVTGDLPRKVVSTNEQVKAATGVDLLRAVQQRLAPPGAPGHD